MRSLFLLVIVVIAFVFALVAVAVSKNGDSNKAVEVQYTKKTISHWDFDSTTCTWAQPANDRQFHVTCVESVPYHPGR